MTPYYQEKDITIYNGDCLDVMKELSQVDLVLTDPPYGIGHKNQNWDKIDFGKEILRWHKGFLKILKENSIGFMWIPKKKLYNLDLPFKFEIFIETKNFAQFHHNIMLDCWVPILMFSKGKPRRTRGKNWFMINSANTGNNENNPRRINHPSVKDIKICRYIIENTTNINDTILDPFLGSGTTLVACKELGRKGIGIEISKEYCDIAITRLKNTVKEMF